MTLDFGQDAEAVGTSIPVRPGRWDERAADGRRSETGWYEVGWGTRQEPPRLQEFLAGGFPLLV